MRILWTCRNCGERLAQVDVRENDPRFTALTAQVDGDIIEVDPEGNLFVHLLCEDCLETVNAEDESEIVFLHGPELH